MGLPANFDRLSMAQLSRLLSVLTPEEYARSRRELVRRFGRLADFVPTLEGEPNNLVFNSLRAGTLFYHFMTFGAVAAQNNSGALFNPAGSGVRVLVWDIWYAAAAAGFPMLYITTNGGAPWGGSTGQTTTGIFVGAVLQSDTPQPAPKATPLQAQQAGIVNQNQTMDNARSNAANTTMHFFNGDGSQPLIELAEGTGVAVEDQTLNEASRLGFMWSELLNPGASPL